MPTWRDTGRPGPDLVIQAAPSGAAPRIMITGASGFVGRRLTTLLAASGSLEVLPVGGPGSSGMGPVVDLADAFAATALVDRLRPDVIVHLAAFSSVGLGAGSPELVWRSNFEATRNLAQAACGLTDGPRFIFASTAEVYGRGFNDGPRDEEAAPAPASAYGRSKLASEYALTDLASSLDVVILRLFNHTGPGQGGAFVVPALAAQLARLDPESAGEVRVGNLEARRDFTDVDDIVDAYAKVVLDPGDGPGVRTYNVGSGRTRSIQSVLDVLIRHHGGQVEVTRDPGRMRPSDIPVNPGVFDRFRARYDWAPVRDFDTTITAIYDYERSQIQGFEEAAG